MAAGVADFLIECGADWAVQVFWQSEQTQKAIPAQGPMDMDIVSAKTGQRLIRLDDGSNGGILAGGAPYGIIQLQISRDVTINFLPGSYVYDLYAYSVGPPLQRVRILRGAVAVSGGVTDLGVALGQGLGAGVLPPDVILGISLISGQVVFQMDPNNPSNQEDNPENGLPQRASLTGPGGFASGAAVVYKTEAGPTGPVTDPQGAPIAATTVNFWLSTGAVITFTYNAQTHGMVISRVESVPGGPPSPANLVVAGTDTTEASNA